MPGTKVDYSDSEEEWDIAAYFSRPYVPLSNLPTPPLSATSKGSSRPPTPDFELDNDENLDPELLGPAIHLSNLIPPNVSLITPSTDFIHAMLSRACLPSPTLALAAIILDSLTSRFSLSWRKALTPTLFYTIPISSNPKLNRWTTNPASRYDRYTPPSIDSLRPELLALAAIVLATKFLHDAESSSAEYASAWGNDIWSVEQLNVAQTVVCDNLQWRILPLCDAELIEEAGETMRLVGASARRKAEEARRSRENVQAAAQTQANVSVTGNFMKVMQVEELDGKKGHDHVRIQSTEFVPVYSDLVLDFH